MSRTRWIFIMLPAALLVSHGCNGCNPSTQKTPETEKKPATLPESKHPNFSWHRLPDKDTDTTICFVHGIFSDSAVCWTREGKTPVYWPDLVADDPEFAKCGIYLGGYYTALGSGKFTVSDAADQLRVRMTQSPTAGQPNPLSYRNIVFVVHSTGGLVVRQLLAEYPEDFKNKKVGLVLVASPTLGSSYAEWLKAIAKAYGNRMAEQLAPSDPNLQTLDDRFLRLTKERDDETRGFCISGIDLMESTFPYGGNLKHLVSEVVPRESVGRDFGKPRRIPDTDHFSIAKPSSSNADVHVYLRSFYMDFRNRNCAVANQPKAAFRDIVFDAQFEIKFMGNPVISYTSLFLRNPPKNWKRRFPRGLPSSESVKLETEGLYIVTLFKDVEIRHPTTLERDPQSIALPPEYSKDDVEVRKDPRADVNFTKVEVNFTSADQLPAIYPTGNNGVP
jgi:pimeloyl-ACP methyl ester carboxylesterase